MDIEINNKEHDILSCLLENEIESCLDYLNDIKGKEEEHFKNHILNLKDILIKFKPTEMCLL